MCSGTTIVHTRHSSWCICRDWKSIRVGYAVVSWFGWYRWTYPQISWSQFVVWTIFAGIPDVSVLSHDIACLEGVVADQLFTKLGGTLWQPDGQTQQSLGHPAELSAHPAVTNQILDLIPKCRRVFLCSRPFIRALYRKSTKKQRALWSGNSKKLKVAIKGTSKTRKPTVFQT